MLKKIAIINFIILFALSFTAFAQDAQELEAERKANEKLKGEHPLFELMKTKAIIAQARIKRRSSESLYDSERH